MRSKRCARRSVTRTGSPRKRYFAIGICVCLKCNQSLWDFFLIVLSDSRWSCFRRRESLFLRASPLATRCDIIHHVQCIHHVQSIDVFAQCVNPLIPTSFFFCFTSGGEPEVCQGGRQGKDHCQEPHGRRPPRQNVQGAVGQPRGRGKRITEINDEECNSIA